jgi:hypothetical protein
VTGPAVEHEASQPSWACRACEQDWPCAPAKVELREQYNDNEPGLIALLALLMWDAFDDGLCPAAQRQQPIPPALRERFLDWADPLFGTAGPGPTRRRSHMLRKGLADQLAQHGDDMKAMVVDLEGT